MPASPESVSLFNALPTPHLLLSPGFVIEAVSDAYLQATLTQREHLVGQYMFDAFPDNPQTPEANSSRNVQASLRQVLATKQPQRIEQQHYDVPDPERPGQFVERYWQALNAPVLDAQGNVLHIIHAAVDITAEVQAQAQLRASQAAEQEARAEAERQRQRFYEVLMQLPAHVAVHEGPDQLFTLVNPYYQRLAPGRNLLGQPIREAWPELVSQGILDVLDHVYRTGEPYIGTELPLQVDFARTGHPEQVYYNAFFLPLRDALGEMRGVLDFSYDVTEQVLVRQQLQQLNQELEARVAERTAELQAALRQTRQQQGQLQQILGQVPAAIAALDGPDHRYRFLNATYQALTGGRARTGLLIAEAIPEVANQGFQRLLDQVYATGQAVAGTEARVELFNAAGQPEEHYIDFIYQPLINSQEQTTGILAFIVDVTEKVRARQHAQALQEELLATAQRQAQERETFQQVFEQTPALIALLGTPGHRYEYVNAAYQALFPGRQLVGLEVAEAAPELVLQGFGVLLDRVYQTGETHFGSEVPFMTSVGGQVPKVRYFNFTYQAYREAGAIAGVSVFAYDVTEQVLTRQAQEAERRELAQLFMQAPAPIVILDGPDLVFQLVNPAYQRIFPGRALEGRPLLDALPELIGTPIPELFNSVYQTGKPVTVSEMPLWMARHQGHAPEEIYWTFTYQARRNGHGIIDGVRVFAYDVTEQVRTRQASEANTRQLRLVTDALPVLIGYLDRELKYRFANRAYEPWFGLEPEQILGQPIREIAGEQAYPNIRPYLERALDGERVEFETEMPFRSHLNKHIRTSYIPDVHQGTVQGLYTLVSDITEQVEARQAMEVSAQQALALAQELATANEQLTRTNVDLDNFIYTASHDLKAPISNIEGLLTALENELPANAQVGEVPELLKLMQGAIDRFKRTIHNLTDLSRLQKAHDPAQEVVAVAAVVQAVWLDLAPLVQQTQAQLEVAIPADLTVLFSEKNLRSVIYNLLSNALKYRHSDRVPIVGVRCQPGAGYTLLEVQDNGLGLDLTRGDDRLFAMFQRLHTHVEGTGIGLYMVKKIVENGGGRIEVESQLGNGATFRVYLP